MGKSSNELQREIEELRAQLSGKTDHVRGRVQGDVEGVRDSFTQQVETVKENANYHALEERVRQNPLTYTAGALGVGVALGMLSDSISIGGSGKSSSSARDQRQPSNESGILGGMLGSLTANLGGTIQEEAQSLIRQAFEGFKAGPQTRQVETQQASVSAAHGQAVSATKP
ncbi:MAG TPA: hypothetical protein VFO84_03590 [Dehalococcoidia bacterium]|nr:hypothetical protein [Dehalococcoidia bacterium]